MVLRQIESVAKMLTKSVLIIASNTAKLLLFLLIALWYGSGAQASPQSGADGWKMLFKTAMGGQYEVFMTQKAIRLKSASFAYTIVAKAPTWDMQIWHDDSKELCHATFKQYIKSCDNRVGTTSSCNLSKLLSKHQTTLPKLGMKTTQYIYAGENRGHDLFVSGVPLDVQNYVVDAVDIKLPPEVIKLITATSTLPELPGLPIQMIDKLPNGTKRWQVLTDLLQPVKVPDSTFAIPSGYKDKGVYKAGFLYSGVSGIMDDVIEGIGVGETKPRTPARRSH